MKEEEYIPMIAEGTGTGQYDSEDISDRFPGPAAEGDFVRLQRSFYLKYGEHKNLSQYVWLSMHTTFHITSTSNIVRKLPTGEDGKIIAPSICKIKQVVTQHSGPFKIEDIEDCVWM